MPRPEPDGNADGNRLATAPPSASQRGYLRTALPSVYLDGDFGLRFVGGLEEVIDPIVDTLDSLPQYLQAELAPAHLLKLFSEWLGLITDEHLPVGVRRELVRNAAELTRRRATAGGLQRLLDLTFPKIELRVEDGGAVTTYDGVAEAPPQGSRRFKVTSTAVLDDEQRAAIHRVIRRERPVHVSYDLIEPARHTQAASVGEP